MAKRAHFIGIAGMGMSAAAILLKESGWAVSGTDEEAYPPATTQLERHDIPYRTSYDAKNIPKDADVIVIGKNAKLTRDENKEVGAAYGTQARIASFPELIGEIASERDTIVVAGSYGKSTTTALLAWSLLRSKHDACWFIGAAPQGMEPAHLGKDPVFIIEGDEYPTSHEDPRPKFAHYRAHNCVITGATHDHVNIYKTHEEYLKAFQSLTESLPEDGILALCADEPHARALEKHTKARVVLYGLAPEAVYRAKDIKRGEHTAFTLMKEDVTLAEISTSLLGSHNVQNIVGAAALLLEKKLLTPEQFARTIKDFPGLERRLDKKTSRASVPAFEGFGSSREKLQSALEALKAEFPNKRIVVIFEPHSFSWRNKHMLHWFDTAFEHAGLVILYKPSEQGAESHEQSTQKEMAARLAHTGVAVVSVETKEETLAAAKKEIRDGDVVLLTSSGAMDGLIEEIPKWLDNTFA